MQGVAMSKTQTMLEGQYKAMAVCWVLGLGTLFAWNSIVTIGDYYYNLFPKYHPSWVFTLLYQPFALATLAVLSYNDSKIDTIRKRILVGYTLFLLGTPMLIFVDLATSGTGGFGYFIATCAIVGAFGVAGGNVEGAVMGELSFMRPEFIQSTFIELLCILLYAIYFPRLPIVKYYRSKAASEGSTTVSADLATAGIQEHASDIEVHIDAYLPNRLSNKH